MSICAVSQCCHFVFPHIKTVSHVCGVHLCISSSDGRLPKRSATQRPTGLQKNSSSGRGLLKLSSTETILRFLPKAASASSASPADFPEQLLEGKPKQKRQSIAGIDQDELQDPSLLADPDSCFCEFKGVQIHHKICDAESFTPSLSEEGTSSQLSSDTRTIGFPLILLHGFGASVFSWNRVMKPLANITGSKVLAFDRPAFGLTSRVDRINHLSPGNEDGRPLNPYSIIFSVMATLYFIGFLAAEKAILVGHSAGSIVAMDTYFEAPERVAALILVAPAIFAPLTSPTAVRNEKSEKSNQVQEENLDPEKRRNPLVQFWSILSNVAKYIRQAIVHIVKGMGGMINSLYKKALSGLLRSAVGVILVRMIIDKFGIPAVRNAWYDSNQVTDHVLQGYTKPLRVKGWDKALVEYTVAMLTDSESESKPPLAKRLSEISCPVLIITGDSDRLVPPWNSERLSRAIPGSSFEKIKGCGHLPQEEKAEEFISIVDKFLRRVFAASDDQHQLAVT